MHRNIWHCMAGDALGLLDDAHRFGVDGLILEFGYSGDLPCHGWNWVFEDLATYDGVPGLEKSGEEREYALRLRASVNEIIHEAAKRGIECFVMGPELSFRPSVLQAHPVLTDPAQDMMYDLAARRLSQTYDALPDLRGIKLYLDEGEVNINDLESPVPQVERMRRIISALHNASRERGRTLIVTTFTLMPHQQRAIVDALKQIAPDEHLVVDNYICPGDWGRIRLMNPAIGDVGGHREIITFDYCGEVWGQSVIPLCQAEFILDSWRAARARGADAIGTSGYVSWRGKALGSLNESSVYTAARLAAGDTRSALDLVTEWAVGRYGEPAAPFVASALMRTRDIVMKSWHDLGFWVQELPKSEPADPAWYNWSLHWESLAIWDDSWRMTEKMLFYPTEETVAAVVAEKDEAIRLAREALADIEKACSVLAPPDYRQLKRYFERELLMCRVFRAYSEAFYRVRMWRGGDRSQELRVRALIGDMHKLADEIGARDDPGFWTCRPERVRHCAGILEDVLAGGEWPEVSENDRVDAWNRQLRMWGYEVQ